MNNYESIQPGPEGWFRKGSQRVSSGFKLIGAVVIGIALVVGMSVLFAGHQDSGSLANSHALKFAWMEMGCQNYGERCDDSLKCCEGGICYESGACGVPCATEGQGCDDRAFCCEGFDCGGNPEGAATCEKA